MTRRILLIEDDRDVARLIKDNLEFEGFHVLQSETGGDALQIAREVVPDLVLLDLMLPDGIDGLALCRTLVESPARVPVIILTAKAQMEDRVRGLQAGADDYVIKPFAFDELLARINAVLRRTSIPVDSLVLGSTSIDFKQKRAFNGKQELEITHLELEVLHCLAKRAGAVVSRDELLRIVWGYAGATPLTRTVDTSIFRLRQKLEPDPRHPKYIRTVYGTGYCLTLDSPGEND